MKTVITLLTLHTRSNVRSQGPDLSLKTGHKLMYCSCILVIAWTAVEKENQMIAQCCMENNYPLVAFWCLISSTKSESWSSFRSNRKGLKNILFVIGFLWIRARWQTFYSPLIDVGGSQEWDSFPIAKISSGCNAPAFKYIRLPVLWCSSTVKIQTCFHEFRAIAFLVVYCPRRILFETATRNWMLVRMSVAYVVWLIQSLNSASIENIRQPEQRPA